MTTAADTASNSANAEGAKLKIRRNAPGSYFIEKYGKRGEIWRYDEGPWRGWWIVTFGPDDYSDPIRTYREAKRAAEMWSVPLVGSFFDVGGEGR